MIVTADHGEGLGEHNLFDHGESLYRTEIRVPLLIVPPLGQSLSLVVGEMVSLRDLPATIVDLLGLRVGSPFPGMSLARFWLKSSPGNVNKSSDIDPVVSELSAPSPASTNAGRSPASRGPLISLAGDTFVYIKNEGDGREQLFDERDDPAELSDKSHMESMRRILDDFRRRADVLRKQSTRSSEMIACGVPHSPAPDRSLIGNRVKWALKHCYANSPACKQPRPTETFPMVWMIDNYHLPDYGGGVTLHIEDRRHLCACVHRTGNSLPIAVNSRKFSKLP